MRFVDHSWDDDLAENAVVGARISGLVGPWCGEDRLGFIVPEIPFGQIRQNVVTMDPKLWMRDI